MKTQFTEIDGLRIRFASHASGHKENVLLLSPLPESILAFTPIWDALAEQYNLLALDLPGFGQSEGKQDLYTAKTMAAFVSNVIDRFSFTLPHIIGPDIGTPVALFVAANFPEKIKSVIISGGACVYPLQVGGFLSDLLTVPDLSGFKNLSVKDAVNGSLSELKNYALPDEIRADYIASYEGADRLIHAFSFLRDYRTALPELDTFLNTLETPVQVIWGKSDPVAPVENARILQTRLPKNKTDIIKDGRHYVWEDNSAEYLNYAVNWLNGGYASV